MQSVVEEARAAHFQAAPIAANATKSFAFSTVLPHGRFERRRQLARRKNWPRLAVVALKLRDSNHTSEFSETQTFLQYKKNESPFF
jgi:hypothetical protein